MVKMLFLTSGQRHSKTLVEALSVMFMRQESTIESKQLSFYNGLDQETIPASSVDRLLEYSLCKIYNSNIAMIRFEKPLKSDKPLIEHFSRDYIGSMLSKPKKAELVEIALLVSQREHRAHLNNWLEPKWSLLNEGLSRTGLEASEIDQLKKIFDTNYSPVRDWISDREKELASRIQPLLQFVIRGY